MPTELLSVRWSGEIAAAITGDYTFTLDSGGNRALHVDGSAALANSIHLEAGKRYAFELECTDMPMAGVTQLSWTSGGPAQIVPSAAFYPIVERRRAAGH